MRNKFWSFLAILFFQIAESESVRASEEKELSHLQVIDSAGKHYPQILSYYEKVNAAEGSALGSLGFFDITLKQNYVDKSRGFYDGKTTDSLIEKELGTFGAKVYGGYRKSFGNFADYEGGSYTNGGGEYRAGAKFSVLRNSSIDQNRLGVILANLGLKESRIQLENIRRKIERDATKAYWNWVAAAKVLDIYEGLYNLALKRERQLEERLKVGDVAQIIVVENKKNILRRKSALAKAKQDLESSAIYLSLFWRDESGIPKIPKHDQAPKTIDHSLRKIGHEKVILDSETALINRPEIRILKIKIEQNSSELKYADNLFKPQLDVEIGASKDLGSGPNSRSQSNNYVGVDFSIPLQQREARGKSAEYSSKLKSLKLESQLMEEQIKAELGQLKIEISTLFDIHDNLVEEAKFAEILENSEREKFKHGASNFFLVNMREQDTAASKAAVVEMLAKYQGSLADYKMAVFSD
jgi:outer membrane protein TolC